MVDGFRGSVYLQNSVSAADIYWGGQCVEVGGSWHLAMVWRAAVGWLAWGRGVVRGLGWHIEMVLACRDGRVGWSANL